MPSLIQYKPPWQQYPLDDWDEPLKNWRFLIRGSEICLSGLIIRAGTRTKKENKNDLRNTNNNSLHFNPVLSSCCCRQMEGYSGNCTKAQVFTVDNDNGRVVDCGCAAAVGSHAAIQRSIK